MYTMKETIALGLSPHVVAFKTALSHSFRRLKLSHKSEYSTALSPGTRLPTEILIIIFQLVRDAWTPFRRSSRREAKLGWVVLTHVCRRWRAILLDMPSLWTDAFFPLARKGWPEQFMQRSRDAPGLRVVLNTDLTREDKRLQQRTLQELLRNLGRVEWLMFYGCQIYEFLRTAIDPAPHLGLLVLGAQQVGRKSAHDGTCLDVSIPPDLFAGHFPRLSALVLNGIPVHPSSPLLSANLTVLHLSRGVDAYNCRGRFLSLLDMIAILRRMHHMQQLVMHDVLTLPTDTLPAALSQIARLDLHHLETLWLYSPWLANYRGFLRTLDHAPSLELHMGSTCTPAEMQPEQDDGHPLIPWAAMAPVRTVEVSAKADETDFTISGRCGPAGPPQYSANITCADASSAEGMRVFLAQHDLLSVESLCFAWTKGPDGRAPLDRAPLLWLLPGVRSITTDRTTSAHDCADLVSALGAGITAAEFTILPCPNLRRLVFPFVLCKERRRGLTAFLDALAAALQRRHAHNAEWKIEELVIGGRKVPCEGPEDLEALRGKVGRELIRAPFGNVPPSEDEGGLITAPGGLFMH